MSFYPPDDDIDSIAQSLMSGFEHGIGLSDTGCRPEEDFQPASMRVSLFSLGLPQQGLGSGR